MTNRRMKELKATILCERGQKEDPWIKRSVVVGLRYISKDILSGMRKIVESKKSILAAPWKSEIRRGIPGSLGVVGWVRSQCHRHNAIATKRQRE